MANKAKKQPNRGFFITFEGPEGSGKSTQARLLGEYLRTRGRSPLLTREPGGTPLAEQLRALTKDFEGPEKMHDATELLLIEAARAQHVRELIFPVLAGGRDVICDRFTDSTTAYQGGARGIDQKAIEFLNRFAVAECVPDLTILLDLPPEAGFARTRVRPETAGKYDRFEEEDLEFHRRVRAAFHAIAAKEPERVKTVSAEQSPERVHEEIKEIVDQYLQ